MPDREHSLSEAQGGVSHVLQEQRGIWSKCFVILKFYESVLGHVSQGWITVEGKLIEAWKMGCPVGLEAT